MREDLEDRFFSLSFRENWKKQKLIIALFNNEI